MPKKTKYSLAVHGAGGRMGREIIQLARANGARVVPLERDGWTDLLPEQIDVVVDFSSPDGCMQALRWCVKRQKALVTGTTGLTAAQRRALAAAGRRIPVFWSANMSIGVHVMARAMRAFAAVRDWDFQIEETHHRRKRDRPSGTAIVLQQDLQTVVEKSLPEPLSRRTGRVVGIHRILAQSPEEMLILEHRALVRTVFARGALVAADWLVKRKGKAGLYTMSDVLSALEEP